MNPCPPTHGNVHALCAHCVQGPCNETKLGRIRGTPPAFMQASQGSLYPSWLVAVAKHILLLPECVGRWRQPSKDIDILPRPN